MEKILLVDDYYGRKNAGINDYLRIHGYYVDSVTNAKEAWEKINSKSYSLVIIDASEDVEIRKGFTLNEMIAEHFPQAIRMCWTAIPGAEYDPILKANYHTIFNKANICEDPKELIETIKTLGIRNNSPKNL